MVGRLDRARWAVVLATVAATPLAFSTWTIDVFNLTALTVLWVGTTVAAGLRVAAHGWRLPRPPVIWRPVAAYVVVLVVATLASRAPMVSLLGSYGRYGGLVTIVPAIALAWLVADGMAGSKRRRRHLLAAIAVSGALGAAYLWSQELGIDAWGWLEPWDQAPRHPPGALGNSNFSGAHLAMALGPAVVLATTARGRARVAWAAAALLVVSGVAVSQSRGAILAVGAALLVLAFQQPRRHRLAASAVVLAAAIGVVALATNDGGSDELFGTHTWSERVDLWEVALEGAADRPLLGGGPDLFRLTFDEHAGPSLAGVVADEPHNVLLDHLDGAGLLGAAAWLAVAAAAVGAALRVGRSAVPFAAMGAAYLAQAMVSIDVVPLVLWGWVAVAGMVGVPPSRRRPRPAVVRSVVVASAVVLLGVVALGPFRADMAHRRGIEASNAGDIDRALFQLEQATDRHGWEPRFHRRFGIQLVLASRDGDDASAAQAADELRRALDLYPDDPIAQEWLGLVSD